MSCMRKARLKAPKHHEMAYYHCISRVVDRQFVFGEVEKERFVARMWDVSWFMKYLRQRFTQWFNHERSRKGTLWEERFKSVLVEGAGEALATMAA